MPDRASVPLVVRYCPQPWTGKQPSFPCVVVARSVWTVVAVDPPRVTEGTKENTWRRLPSEGHLL